MNKYIITVITATVLASAATVYHHTYDEYEVVTDSTWIEGDVEKAKAELAYAIEKQRMTALYINPSSDMRKLKEMVYNVIYAADDQYLLTRECETLVHNTDVYNPLAEGNTSIQYYTVTYRSATMAYSTAILSLIDVAAVCSYVDHVRLITAGVKPDRNNNIIDDDTKARYTASAYERLVVLAKALRGGIYADSVPKDLTEELKNIILLTQ